MGVKRIDSDRARELLESGSEYTYVDVRTPEEFEEGHISQARNIPVMLRGKGGFGFEMNKKFVDYCEDQFQKTSKIILGCRKGGRSTKAAELLSEAGFTNIFDMRGGLLGETDPFGRVTFPGWTTKGFPLTTESAKEQLYVP